MGNQIGSKAKPRLSIGLPVYNGDQYIAAAIGSLLDQTYHDFELIIADNGSTDRTEEICRRFSAIDNRIQYHRFEENRGAAANYNFTLSIAKGELFKWAAHDDICKPAFLEYCINLLDQNPKCILCHSVSGRIDEHNRFYGVYNGEPECIEKSTSHRFARMILTPHLCIPVFGVMRKSELLKTKMHGDWVGADRNLLAELALRGEVHQVKEILFLRRQHAQSSVNANPDEQLRLSWFNPNAKGGGFPTWRRLREYLYSISAVSIGFSESALCYWHVVRWCSGFHHTGVRTASLLWSEVISALSVSKKHTNGPSIEK